jgi:hypothetical protein
LTSDLFDVLLPLLCGTKADFLGEATPAPMDKTAKLADFSEMTLQRNSLRGHNPQQSIFLNFLEEQVAFSHPRYFKRLHK